LVLNFEDVSNDQLDGVIGLAPNTENNPNADMILTGEVNLDFRNLFGAGRQLALNWRNYLQRSQKLMASGAIPYIFGTKLGVNGSVLINKFDTFFVSSERSIGLDYRFRGNSFIGFYNKVNASSLISVDTAAIRASRRIPQNNPYRIASYGFKLNYAQLDFFQNPRKGVVFRSDISIGTRNILRDNRIDELIFKTLERPDGFSLYDTLSIIRNLRGKIDFSAEFYLPLFKKATIYNQISGGALIAPNVLFNEYYNYGGFSTLRGFDELSLFARNYIIHNLEYRYLLNVNSFVGAFINYSMFQNDFNELRNWDLPIGVGFSGRIGVGKGQLNLAYALGRQNEGPFRFSSGKIHFGYINYL
jgi:outer membrane protein assembly factor BamA